MQLCRLCTLRLLVIALRQLQDHAPTRHGLDPQKNKIFRRNPDCCFWMRMHECTHSFQFSCMDGSHPSPAPLTSCPAHLSAASSFCAPSSMASALLRSASTSSAVIYVVGRCVKMSQMWHPPGHIPTGVHAPLGLAASLWRPQLRPSMRPQLAVA